MINLVCFHNYKYNKSVEFFLAILLQYFVLKIEKLKNYLLDLVKMSMKIICKTCLSME